jgi:flagellar biosynthesis/type III secretory pathway chaperone
MKMLNELLEKFEEMLESSMPVDVLRRMLGVKEEDLVDRLEAVDWERIEEKEKERLRRPYES